MTRFRAVVAAAVIALIAGCGGKSASQSNFDGDRAYDLLKKQCAIGPRYSGTPGQSTTADLIQSELKGKADSVRVHTFTESIDNKNLLFKNVYAVFNPNASHFVLLCTHWDTRPIADMELDRAKQSKPILGANDGASGTAILLELARQFQAAKPKVGVVMAFFDGEDYGTTPLTMFIGAKKFAENWKNEVRPGGREPKYDYGILLDMVGDKDLEIRRDAWSMMKNPKIVDKVWAAARNSGHSDAFLEDGSYSVDDDHIPISVAGIKCIDVIDFNYASWHTLDDTPDKCSPKSLKTVGDVISKVIYDENPGK